MRPNYIAKESNTSKRIERLKRTDWFIKDCNDNGGTPIAFICSDYCFYCLLVFHH